MSFLQDFGGFLGDVNVLGDEMNNLKHDVIASIVDGATEIKGTLDDTATNITASAQQVGDTVTQATTSPLQQTTDDVQSDT